MNTVITYTIFLPCYFVLNVEKKRQKGNILCYSTNHELLYISLDNRQLSSLLNS